jgi:indole-3-glycerol phosphate synthase
MYLDNIAAAKREEVAELKSRTTVAELERAISSLDPPRGFVRALTSGRKRNIGLIAEVKKASPSKGLIRADFHPVELAQSYERGGADCLSVLTDRRFFQGAPEYLTDVRQAVSLPVLRKDFIIDPIQIYEARAIGADAILLIAAMLDARQLKEFAGIAADLGMDVLAEVHDEEELERVLELSPRLIGINNRNLRTFVTDLRTTERLMERIPDSVAVVSESGISAPGEIDYLRQLGVDAVLIGEHFMRQPDVEQAVSLLLGPMPQAEEASG